MKQKQKSEAFVKAEKLNCCFIIRSNLGANKESVEVWKRWAQSSQEVGTLWQQNNEDWGEWTGTQEVNDF